MEMRIRKQTRKRKKGQTSAWAISALHSAHFLTRAAHITPLIPMSRGIHLSLRTDLASLTPSAPYLVPDPTMACVQRAHADPWGPLGIRCYLDWLSTCHRPVAPCHQAPLPTVTAEIRRVRWWLPDPPAAPRVYEAVRAPEITLSTTYTPHRVSFHWRRSSLSRESWLPLPSPSPRCRWDLIE
jgi:hypothetical protein